MQSKIARNYSCNECRAMYYSNALAYEILITFGMDLVSVSDDISFYHISSK